MAELCLFCSFIICLWQPVSEWEYFSCPSFALVMYIKLHAPYFPLDCWSHGNICCSVRVAHITCHLAVLLFPLLKCIHLKGSVKKQSDHAIGLC